MAGRLRSRIVGTMVACAMSLYATGALPQLAFADPGCCCHHHSGDCRCAACTHARGLASGRPMVETCGAHPASAVPVAPRVFALTGGAHPLPAATSTSVGPPPLSKPPEPVCEVPTPPPVALS